MSNKPSYEELRTRIEVLELDTVIHKQAEAAANESKKKFNDLFNKMSSGVVFCKAIYDDNKNMSDCIYIDMNPAYEKFTNLKKETAIGKKVSEMLPGTEAKWFTTLGEVVKTGNPISFEMHHEQSQKHYNVFAYKSKKDEFSAIFYDISERKQTKEALQESEERYRALSEASFEAIFLSEKGICLEQNQAAEELFGYKLSESIGKPGTDWIIPEDRELVKNHMMSGYELPYEVNALRRDGTSFPAEIQGKMMRFKERDVRVTALRNISNRKQADEKIKASLQEKETLLHEIHHRVKNNLAIVSSLLGLQANTINDTRSKDALMESRNRVNSMSMIHETLYQSENLSLVDMNNYLLRLSSAVARNHSASGDISIKVDAENVKIESKQASPIGLIVNELIANSFKYAFPQNQKGEIKISMKKKQQQLELIYSDNGVGIPKDFDWKNAKSMGLRLLKILSEGQLGGSVQLNQDQGTSFTIKFECDET